MSYPTFSDYLTSISTDTQNTVFEDEAILITKCVAWDRQAQNALYKLYASKMYAVCLRYSRDQAEAEDTLQEGFMKVFENIKMFRKQGSLEGWIRTIMYHTAIEKFRRRKPEENAVASINDNDINLNHLYTDDTLSDLSSKELIGLVQNLPPACRMVFNLYVFEGLTHKKISEKLKISEGTSKSNLYDARAILQRTIKNNLKSSG